MNFCPYKFSDGKLTKGSFLRSLLHFSVAWILLESWSWIFHHITPKFADLASSCTAAFIVVVTLFLVGFYNDTNT